MVPYLKIIMNRNFCKKFSLWPFCRQGNSIIKQNVIGNFQFYNQCVRFHNIPVLRSSYFLKNNKLLKLCNPKIFSIITRGLKKNGDENISHLFVPVHYEKSPYEESLGEDIVGPLNKEQVLSIIHQFYSDKDVKELAKDQGLDKYLYQQTIISFRKFCTNVEKLPTDVHIVLNDILKGASHLHDLYPYFFKHAKDIFPHLNCMDDLYKVSDLSGPPNWYPEARAINRKIIYHAGPTNSGKTYHAMEQYLAAGSGVYCGPLKLLAVEVAQKSNEKGTPCDLITGEERKYAVSEDFPSQHTACTIEMTSITTQYDVAILDEIQMMKDNCRGWAWTRAFLGVCAKEVHICGEGAAIDLVRNLAMTIGEDVEVRRYKRLTPLTVEDTALVSLSNVQPGDCIVCFSKAHIHSISQAIEKLGHEVGVIYGALPPTVKLSQSNKFNDPKHRCNILVATDAIGMGLNLSIRRIIFYSLIKPFTNDKGEKEMNTIDVSQALQISGRAGRYGTQYDEGYVTTMKASDLPVLRKILNTTPSAIETAGLNPTAEQIELFSFHLPTYTLSNLIDIFTNLCTVESSLYFMCRMDDFKFLADLIQHIPLPLKARYIFCCSPINKKMTFVCALFLKFARKYSVNEPITMPWLCQQVKWPFVAPRNILELIYLEEVSNIFDLYLWFGHRFPEMFPDSLMIESLEGELNKIIENGVTNITQILRNTEMPTEENIDKLLKIPVIKKKIIKYDHISNSSTDSQKKGKKTMKTKLPNVSFAQQLVRKGIVTEKMLLELQSEWSQTAEGGKNKNKKKRGK